MWFKNQFWVGIWFFNKHQLEVVEKFRLKEPVLGIWRNQNQTTTVLGICSGYVKKNQNAKTTGFGYFKNLKELQKK
jgi:hypothetical protein